MDLKNSFKNRRRAKKALLFSLISLLFSALFITLFSQNILTTQEDRIISSNIRVKVIDTYVRNFEVYLGDSVRVSSYKTLDAITVYRDSSGTKFFASRDQFRSAFNNCMMCGYFDCTTNATSCGLNGDHLTAKIENVVNLSLHQLNINTTYAIHSINITQNYPFEVEVTINLSYNVTDNSGVNNYARWNRTQVITESVTIIGLLDPLGYMNDSTNTYARRINSTQICDIGETCWDFTNTQAFYL
ncbi:MAG TPA: hypothetical protein VEC16_04730, partial [Alphaproteobacteria bacterium]|nr:hypothetical protein [Alphaproteobacteria bacterium]